MPRPLSRWILVAVLAALVAAATSGAGAQAAAPCAPGTVTGATVKSSDARTGDGGALVATHDIDLRVDFADTSVVDDSTIQWSAPPGATLKPNDGPLEFATLQSDTAGAVPITVSWMQSVLGSTDECSASTSTTIQLQPAAPFHLSKAPKEVKSKLFGAWDWESEVGSQVDRRPIELRLRGVTRARLPGANVPFKVTTIALRSSDPGSGRQRTIRLHHGWWAVDARFDSDDQRFIMRGSSHIGFTKHHSLGYELQLLQANRLLLRIRATGTCYFDGCVWRTLKVERS
jgi:hypothetical protein